jgi:hypothetical protein
MTNDVNPFIIPSQQSSPNLKPRQRRNLFSEYTTHTSQGNDISSFYFFRFFRETGEVAAIETLEGFFEKDAYEGGAADVEVGEVGRV